MWRVLTRAARRLRTTRTAFFFFQAEDCIRYLTVTGVQTCALPISRACFVSSPSGRGQGGGYMKVGAVKEILPGERRVALVPDTVTKLVAATLEVSIQAGAGSEAFYSDDAYQKAGATLVADGGRILSYADAG